MNIPTHRWLWNATLGRIVDADTIDCDIDMGFRVYRHRERLRLVGPDARWFDAPELRGAKASQAGREAMAYVEGLLMDSAELRLETFKSDGRDAFGRWLACVWLANDPDGEDLATRLVHTGHGAFR